MLKIFKEAPPRRQRGPSEALGTTSEFDRYHETYEATVQGSVSFSGLPHSFFLTAKVDLLSALFASHFGSAHRPSLLDVGCGIGRMHPLLRPIVSSLSATDPSRDSLNRAARENAGVTYRHGDGQILPWPDAEFDSVLAVCALHHVEPTRWTAFIEEMRRVVSPGGLVVIIEHNPWNPLTRLSVLRCPFDADAVLLGAARARALLAAADLDRVQSRHFLLLPKRGAFQRRLEAVTSRWPLGAQYAAFGVR